MGDVPEGITLGRNAPPGQAVDAVEGRKSNLPVALEGDVGYGVRIGGVPVGDDQFMLNFVKRVTSGVCGHLNQPQINLRSGGFFDEAWHVMRLSQSHRLDYLMQVVPPGVPGVQEELQRFGGLLREEEVRTLGVNVYDPVQLEDMGVPAAAAAAVAARARLPSRM